MCLQIASPIELLSKTKHDDDQTETNEGQMETQVLVYKQRIELIFGEKYFSRKPIPDHYGKTITPYNTITLSKNGQ